MAEWRDPQRQSPSTSGVRRQPNRRRGITAGLTALAFITAAAAPTSATASVSAAHQSVTAATCDPRSGTRAVYSADESAKVNGRMCVEVRQRADGSQYVHAYFGADIWYKWGVGWYADCTRSNPCVVLGTFQLHREHETTRLSTFSSHTAKILHGNNVNATADFDAYPGHYKVTVAVEKRMGYWGSQSGDANVRANTLAIEVDVP
ncbi:hypothetical protein [Nonomuraea sp. NPDC049141]|uniref:hypothetical protein n=1 Tax=Nonomuraea sp. NPDC049141 TaxID=3155500 RepID=UPI0033C14CF9